MVKIILTGATGFCGEIALRHYISRSDITSIIILTRRDIQEELKKDPKVTVIIHDDFTSYPTELLKRLDGAVACIWALGLRGAPFGYKDLSYAEKVDVEYPMAAATAFSQYFAPPENSNSSFRFVLLSGIGAELDQTKSFWMMHDTRLIKGRIEQRLHDLAKENKAFEVYTCRPFGIMEENPPFMKALVFRLLPSVTALELAALMLELGLQGSKEWIWENTQIAEKGAEALQRRR